jgi:REP element-mobilizing transposase RayT
MNDHVHVVLRPLDGRKLESIVQSRKSFTSHEIQKVRGGSGQVWMHEYFDRIVRDDKELEQKRDYILRNPFTRWPELESYEWLWPQPE